MGWAWSKTDGMGRAEEGTWGYGEVRGVKMQYLGTEGDQEHLDWVTTCLDTWLFVPLDYILKTIHTWMVIHFFTNKTFINNTFDYRSAEKGSWRCPKLDSSPITDKYHCAFGAEWAHHGRLGNFRAEATGSLSCSDMTCPCLLTDSSQMPAGSQNCVTIRAHLVS